MTTPANDEWMSAKEALEYFLSRGVSYYEAKTTIFDRAHEGLIGARAKLVTVAGARYIDDEVPPDLWAEELSEKWDAGDFAIASQYSYSLKAFGVEFRRSDIEQMGPPSHVSSGGASFRPAQSFNAQTVFIGHGGRSSEWLKLEKFLRDRLRLFPVEFNSTSPAGISTTARLKEMLDQADFALLILTGEDEQATGEFHPRLNVVHEAGMFQGKLGFERAIILLEEGCEKFSNVHGLNHIAFPRGNIDAAFEKIRSVLEREGLV